MTTQQQYIKSGFLVVGGISQKGCTTYTQIGREETPGTNDDLEGTWQTHKRVRSVTEQKRLSVTRLAMSNRIAQLGAYLVGFGYVVPTDKGAELEAELARIQEQCAEYNRTASFTRLQAFFSVFELSSGDEKVARALYSQTVDMLEKVSKSIAAGNVKDVRLALSQLGNLETVLPTDKGEKLSAMIGQARAAARAAVKAVKKAGVTNGEDIVRAAMNTADVDGIRATVVETLAEIESHAQVYIPVVDARQIE